MGSGEPQTVYDLIADHHVLTLLQAASTRTPEKLEILFELGDLLTRLGHVDEGLEVDLKLATLLPDDPIVHYNLACSYSLLDRHEEAFSELQTAIKLGYDDPAHMSEDQDLAPLRHDPRFQVCLRTLTHKGG